MKSGYFVEEGECWKEQMGLEHEGNLQFTCTGALLTFVVDGKRKEGQSFKASQIKKEGNFFFFK